MKRRVHRPRKPASLGRTILSGVLSAAIVMGPFPMAGFEKADALPRGGAVIKGHATLGYSTAKLLVSQSTQSASFSWSSFNVKSGQSVVYRTPGSKSVSLNFIGGTSPARISGSVRSNGILEFMDANGIVFGQGSTVSAAGVMAFGSKTPWGAPTGAVSNAGTISVSPGGVAALVGTSVSNTGTITAPGGEVVLAAGSTVTPMFSTGSSSFSVATSGGGTVADSGIISAREEGGQSGRIVLKSGMDSGTTTLAPTAVLDASAPNGGNGGAIETSGARVNVDPGAFVTTAAPDGTTGTWTLDPQSFYIGMNTGTANSTSGKVLNYEDISAATLDTLLASNNVVIDSTQGSNGSLGNIYVDSALSWTSTNKLTLNAVNNVEVNAGIAASSGSLTLRADDMALTGTTSNTTGGGVPSGNGTVAVNSGGSLSVGGTLDIYYNPVNYATPTTYTNSGTAPHAFMLLSSPADLEYIDGQQKTSGILSANYALNANLALGPSWTPFGNATTSYSGIFNGQGYLVSGYTVTATANDAGFFGSSSGTIENLGVSGSVSGAGFNNIGGVVGYNTGTVEYSYNAGTVAGGSGSTGATGSSGTSTSTTGGTGGTGGDVGGLVGANFSTGTVEYSYNTGRVTGESGGAGGPGYTGTGGGAGGVGGNGGAGGNTGGIVGSNDGKVEYSYNTGPVTGGGGGAGGTGGTGSGAAGGAGGTGGQGGITGGIVGTNQSSALVEYSYNDVQVTAGGPGAGGGGGSGSPNGSPGSGGSAGSTGGAVGDNASTVTSSFFNSATSSGIGTGTNAGTIGISSSSFGSESSFTGATGGWSSSLFNSWSGSGFSSGATTSPWYLASSGMSSPVLVGAMSTDSIVATNASAVYTGLVYSGTPGVTQSTSVSGTIGYSYYATSPTNAGTYVITPSISSASAPTTQSGIGSFSYALGTLSITGLPVTATANAASMTYGGTVPSLSGTLSTTGPTGGLANLSTTWTTTATGASNVGSYGITSGGYTYSNGAVAGDFTITQASGNSTALTINPLAVTATANAASMTYGGPVPSLSGTFSTTGSTGGLSNLSGTWSTIATSSSIVGSYGITSGGYTYSNGAVAGDFTIAQASGNSSALTINFAALTLSTTLSKVYDGTTTAALSGSNATLSGFVNSQSGALTSASGTFTSSNVGSNIGGTVSLSTSDLNSGSGTGFSWSNYSLPTKFTGGSITALPVTATANTASMTYGGTVPSLSGTFSTTGPTGGLSNLSGTWSTTATSSSNVGYYPSNLNIQYSNGSEPQDFIIAKATGNATALQVKPAPLSASISSSISKVYDGTSNVSLSGSDILVSGFQNGNSATVTNATGTYYDSNGIPVSNVGSGYSVSIQLRASSFTAASGTLLSNYKINGTQLTGTNVADFCDGGGGSITPASLKISTSLVKAANGQTGIVLTSSNTTFSGLPSGQTATLSTDISAKLSSSCSGVNLGGTLALTASDLTGNGSFLTALSAGDYILPSTFSGGSILPTATTSTIPVLQVVTSLPSLSQSVSSDSGSQDQGTLLSAFVPTPILNFGSSLAGGLSLGDLSDDSSTIFDMSTANTTYKSRSKDQTVLAVDSGTIQPVESKAVTVSRSGNGGGDAGVITLDGQAKNVKSQSVEASHTLTLAGSASAPYSLQVPTFHGSGNGVFESSESQ